MKTYATLIALAALGGAGLWAQTPAQTGPVMPLPAEQAFGGGELTLSPNLAIELSRDASPRLRAAVQRLREAWSRQTGIRWSESTEGAAPAPVLTVVCDRSDSALPGLGDDESYTLTIDSHRAALHSARDAGALRGLATLTQLATRGPNGWSLPAATMRDAPRFAWRGLLIDVCRHWIPLPVIERNLDAMALVKLNVLHLHLSDDQGFRVESRTHPELQRLGSDGHYFSRTEIAEIVAYAAERCIRVVPEFDVPGHTTSWLVAHPELASAPGPYQLKRQWGVFDAVLDPTNERTYALVEEVMAEMGGLFPDAFMHLGGDENNGHQWTGNPGIQAFIREHRLTDNAGLQVYFNQRLDAFLAGRGKRVMGWDEILHPELPRDAMIDSWRGTAALAAAARLGFSGIMAHGYYLDHPDSAADEYLNDPVPAGSRLTAAERSRILGGEASMWSELVGPETIDSRIWPRAAAIAERFWSGEQVRDVGDMYRRLALVSARLTEAGVRHESNHEGMIDHLVDLNTAPGERQALRTFVDLLEPEGYHRVEIQIWMNQGTPLTGLADVTRPDRGPARAWRDAVSHYLFAPGALDRGAVAALAAPLDSWSHAARVVLAMGGRREYPALREAKVPAEGVLAAVAIAQAALNALADGRVLSREWQIEALATLDRAAADNLSATNLPFLPAVRWLTLAAGAPAAARRPGEPDWRARLEGRTPPARS